MITDLNAQLREANRIIAELKSALEAAQSGSGNVEIREIVKTVNNTTVIDNSAEVASLHAQVPQRVPYRVLPFPGVSLSAVLPRFAHAGSFWVAD